MNNNNIKEKIAYEIHKPARKSFLRRSFKLLGINETLQIDLDIDIQKYSKENNGSNYILTVIDTFSKKAYAVPLKSKEGLPVTEGMRTILKPIHKFKNIQSDQGNEFFNKHFRALMKAHNINHYHTFSTTKAAIVERFQRTLKHWLYREFSAQGSYYWLDILPKLIRKYNNKVYRSIGMKPNQVNSGNSKYVTSTKKSVFSKAKFKLGDAVRISKYKHIFS